MSSEASILDQGHMFLVRIKLAYLDAGHQLEVIESRLQASKANLGLPNRRENISPAHFGTV